MLQMVKGCKPPFPERLAEGCEIQKGIVCANVNAGKIEPVLRHFLALHAEEPLFFVLELPANAMDEAGTKEGAKESAMETFHTDVYFIDGCDEEKALSILDDFGELLIHDGISRFGFGAPGSREEILLDKYNVLLLYSPSPEKYESFFASHGIPRVERLITAWDSFSEETPGRCDRYETGGVNVFSLPELLRERGLYFAERREDK